MKINLEVKGSLARQMQAEIAGGERAVATAMRGAAQDLKTAWRAQIRTARLGSKLANTVRSDSYPKGQPSINAVGLVFTRAPRIIDAHDRGALIRSSNGFFLAIPTEAAGRGVRGRRLTPGEWERRTGLRLRLVYRRRGPSLLVADRVRINKRGRAAVSRAKTGRNQVTAPIFVLVPQVRLRKRLNLDRDTDRIADQIPGRITKAWLDIKARA